MKILYMFLQEHFDLHVCMYSIFFLNP